jgi:hypothetical protein
MGGKERIEITIETSHIIVIRRRPAWCPACALQVELLTAEEAAAAVGVSSSPIHRGAESGQLHASEAADGTLYVCLNSLLNSTTKGETP